VKKSGRDELIGVVIHIYMETTQGISLCSYLYLKLAKCHVSVILTFFFYKIGEQEGRTGSRSAGDGGVGIGGRGEEVGERAGRRIWCK
jgi:hypothetical protein